MPGKISETFESIAKDTVASMAGIVRCSLLVTNSQGVVVGALGHPPPSGLGTT